MADNCSGLLQYNAMCIFPAVIFFFFLDYSKKKNHLCSLMEVPKQWRS